MAKVEKVRQAPQLILGRTRDVAANIDQRIAVSDEGREELFRLLDSHYMPNTFARKQLIKIENTSNITWTEFMQKMKKCRTDLIA